MAKRTPGESLADTRILVTGASSGLGLAMAEALLRAGAEVALAARPTPRLGAAVARLSEGGLHARALPMDVTSVRSVEESRRWVEQRWGAPDVLVNNAGIGMRTVNPRFMVDSRPFYEVSPDDCRAVIDTNLTGYFLVARAFAPMMARAGHGKIINISMNHETMRRRGFIPYGPSRAGAESLSLIMAADLLGTGVTVNMLLPGGAADTGMIPPELKSSLKRPLLDPALMGPPIRFLASSRSDGLTGERVTATRFADWLSAQGRAEE
jgi:NAD(P)-dependent dehydrogenase (short-subunit alcohol dehydrogenase family)